jgi:hypothetical protein
LKLKASLASAEVSAGAVAKADQKLIYIWSEVYVTITNFTCVWNEDDLQCKRPTSDISQEPIIGSFQNLRLKLMWPNQTLHMFQI